MKKISEKVWECDYCGEQFEKATEAQQCEAQHDIVYIPIPRTQVYNLVRYFVTNDISLLPEEFIRHVTRFAKRVRVE